MNRIFLGLASLQAAALVLTAAFGFTFDAQGPAPPYHWHAGLWTSVLTLFLHSLVLTYFIGTGRWVREVGEAYGLPDYWHRRSWASKVRSIAFALVSMLLVIAAAASGAATDPGATVRLHRWMGLSGATLHLVTSIVAIAANAVSYVFEYRAIRENGAIIEEVMQEVARIRAARMRDRETVTSEY